MDYWITQIAENEKKYNCRLDVNELLKIKKKELKDLQDYILNLIYLYRSETEKRKKLELEKNIKNLKIQYHENKQKLVL